MKLFIIQFNTHVEKEITMKELKEISDNLPSNDSYYYQIVLSELDENGNLHFEEERISIYG